MADRLPIQLIPQVKNGEILLEPKKNNVENFFSERRMYGNAGTTCFVTLLADVLPRIVTETDSCSQFLRSDLSVLPHTHIQHEMDGFE